MAKAKSMRGKGSTAITGKQRAARKRNIKIAQRSKKKSSGKSFRKKEFEKARKTHESKLKKFRKKHGRNIPSHIEKQLLKYM